MRSSPDWEEDGIILLVSTVPWCVCSAHRPKEKGGGAESLRVVAGASSSVKQGGVDTLQQAGIEVTKDESFGAGLCPRLRTAHAGSIQGAAFHPRAPNGARGQRWRTVTNLGLLLFSSPPTTDLLRQSLLLTLALASKGHGSSLKTQREWQPRRFAQLFLASPTDALRRDRCVDCGWTAARRPSDRLFFCCY